VRPNVVTAGHLQIVLRPRGARRLPGRYESVLDFPSIYFYSPGHVQCLSLEAGVVASEGTSGLQPHVLNSSKSGWCITRRSSTILITVVGSASDASGRQYFASDAAGEMCLRCFIYANTFLLAWAVPLPFTLRNYLISRV
jgi:hypothetical protein